VYEVEVGFDGSWTSSPESESYLRGLAELLPICLGRFSGLTILNIQRPSFSYSQNPDATFPQDLMRLLTNTAVKALRYVPLPELRELSLNFPITYEFSQFLQISLLCPEYQLTLSHNGFSISAFWFATIQGVGDSDTGLPLSPRQSPAFPIRVRLFSFVDLSSSLGIWNHFISTVQISWISTVSTLAISSASGCPVSQSVSDSGDSSFNWLT
jgi:hypothetical protein